jgi:glycosyltransferase involved in cell wall biosynthesis
MTEPGVLVLVTTSFPIRDDGSEAAGSFVADLAVALAEHVSVRVVAPGSRSMREQWNDRIEVIRYAAPLVALSTLKPWRISDLLDIVRVLRAGMAATRAAVADDVSDVLALWGLPCGEWARRAARRRAINYSVWMLGSDVWSLGRVPVLRCMLARVIRQAQRAFADGYKLAEDAQCIGRVPVSFLPSTRQINLADVPPPRAEPPYRLLFLGRWHPNKGIDLLLEALALLDANDWCRIECVEIQGGGPMDALVRERVAALWAQGHPVELGGFLAKPAAEAAIARADWVLIPSRIESIPVVFSDAMKIGRPIICAPVGDLPRLVAEFSVGICSSAVASDSMAAAIRKSLLSPADGFAAGVEAAACAFSLERIILGRLLEQAGDA